MNGVLTSVRRERGEVVGGDLGAGVVVRGNLEVVAGGGRQTADRVHPLRRLDVVADESPVAPSLLAVLDDEVEDGTAAVAPRVQPHRDRCGVDGKQLRGLGHHRGCRPQQRLMTQKSTSSRNVRSGGNCTESYLRFLHSRFPSHAKKTSETGFWDSYAKLNTLMNLY